MLEDVFAEETRAAAADRGIRTARDGPRINAWRQLKGDVQRRIAEIERKQKTVREPLDRLDEALRILGVARALPSASKMWVHWSLNEKQFCRSICSFRTACASTQRRSLALSASRTGGLYGSYGRRETSEGFFLPSQK